MFFVVKCDIIHREERRKNMKLSLKHTAIFGRVIVNLQGINSSFYKYTDLYTLYKGGWFITERFGNTLCMCKRKTNGEFMNKFFTFRTEVNINTLDLLWKPIALEKQQQYSKYLFGKPERKKYTYKKVD